MRKILILLFILVNFLFSYEIEKLTNLNQIKKNQNSLIMFSTSYCPWCARQRLDLEEIYMHYENNMHIFEVKDSDKFYKKLIKKYPFTIRFYPTTFIVEMDEDDLHIKYEFQGLQKKKTILDALNSENDF